VIVSLNDEIHSVVATPKSSASYEIFDPKYTETHVLSTFLAVWISAKFKSIKLCAIAIYSNQKLLPSPNEKPGPPF